MATDTKEVVIIGDFPQLGILNHNVTLLQKVIEDWRLNNPCD